MGRTLADKLWDAHVVRAVAGEPDLLYIDLHLLHEVNTPQAFDGLRAAGRTVRRPELTLATEDHATPTDDLRKPIADPVAREYLDLIRRNCEEFGIELYSLGAGRRGIVHVIGPELGLTQPGMTIACCDSHTTTHGAFGTLAFGIGTSQVEHVRRSRHPGRGRPRRRPDPRPALHQRSPGGGRVLAVHGDQVLHRRLSLRQRAPHHLDRRTGRCPGFLPGPADEHSAHAVLLRREDFRPLLARIIRQEDPFRMDIDHLAFRDRSGAICYDREAPYQVIFRPTLTSSPQRGSDFRGALMTIPAASELYEAWVRYAADGELIRAGAVVTTSEFVASEFGDRVLHFHHRRRGVD